MTPFRIRNRIKRTVQGIVLGSACCAVIYGTMVIWSVKGILRIQAKPVDY